MLSQRESSAPSQGGAEAEGVRPPHPLATGASDRALTEWLVQHIPPASPGDLSRFVAFFGVLRWATLSTAIILGLVEGRYKQTMIAGTVLAAGALWLTLRPPHYQRGGWRISAELLAELAVGVVVVEATGFAASPFLITLFAATTIAGFAGGLRILSGLAVIAGLSVALPTVLLSPTRLLPSQDAAAIVQMATLIVLVGGAAGYCRYLVEDSGQDRRGLAAQVEQLSTMNGLLLDLHSAAEQVATPFDLDGAVKWAFDRLEAQFTADVAAVLLRNTTTGHWHIAEAKGLQLPDDRWLSLPAALQPAADGDEPQLVADDLRNGLSNRSRWGLYSPMRVQGELVGLLVVEFETLPPRVSADQDLHSLGDLASTAALAVGNARWLQRLHVLSVEQERARLARDLHDRVGQSLMYLGLEVDRLTELNLGRAAQHDLLNLRAGLGTLLGELSDTLVDLRSDVSEETDVATLLHSFVNRMNRRGSISASVCTEGDRRLPIVVEREMWLIAREAVTNAERHSGASQVSVLWKCDQSGALLEVVDDGVGLPAAHVGSKDAISGYGLLGMRERADAIRAQLDIVSHPHRGTVVRAHWGGR